MAASDRQLLIEVIASDEGSEPTIRENTAALQDLDERARSAGKALENYSGQQSNVRLSSRRSNMVLLDTSRIIQDIPFGLRSIANNVDPFVQSLQRARAETGSWRQVLGGLMGSLTGPAGIAIGVSTVTSILVSFGPQIAEFFGFFQEGKKSIDDANESLSVFAEVFESEFSSSLGELDLEKELEVLRSLKDQFVLEEGETPAFGQIDWDQIRQGANEAARSAAMISEHSMDAYQASLDQIDVAFQRNDKIREIIENRLAEAEATQLVREELEKLGILEELRLQEIRESRKEANEELADAKDALMQSMEASRREEDFMFDAQIDAEIPGLSDSISGSDFMGARGIDGMTNALQRYGFTLQQISGMTAEHGRQILMQHRNAEMLAQTVQNSLITSFSEMGTVLGDIMSADFEGGVFDRFQVLFSTFLSGFGDQLIALGVGKIALDNLFKGPLGGPAAIAAGIALKAAATAVRNNAEGRLNQVANGGAQGNTIIGYRGLEIEGDSPVGRVQGSGSRTIRIEDGFGNMVAKGQEEIDRGGGSNYMRGGG